MSFLINTKISCRAALCLSFFFQICSGFSTFSIVSCPATFRGAKCKGGGQLLRNGRVFSASRGRELKSHRLSALNTRSALASPELSHLLKEYGVPAILTHACGWFICMVALFSASNSGLDTDVLISYLPATFQVESPIFRNGGRNCKSNLLVITCDFSVIQCVCPGTLRWW
jgi:hypothetical protein